MKKLKHGNKAMLYFNIIGMFSLIFCFAFVSKDKIKGYKKTDTGLYYKFYKQNKDAQKPEIGDVLTVEMTYKLKGNNKEKDSVIYSSNGASAIPKLQLIKPIYKGDISEGLAMMAAGDSASFIISADSFYLRDIGIEQLPDFVKPGSKLVFEIKLLSVQKKADYEKEQKDINDKNIVMNEERKAKELGDIKKYITDNKIDVKPTTTGLYYIETKKGTGQQAIAGKTVKVNYTGKFLDGTIFDSSEGRAPIEFTLGAQQVIAGWDEGIALMQVGGKATFVIPSSLAYAEYGAGNAIPPYTPIDFDVELIDVK